MSRAVQRKRKRLSKSQVSAIKEGGGSLDFDGDSRTADKVGVDGTSVDLIDNNDYRDLDQAVCNYNVSELTLLGIVKSTDFSVIDVKAAAVVRKMLDSVTLEDFYSYYWEKKPLHVSKRGKSGDFSKLFSKNSIALIANKQLLIDGSSISFYARDDPISVNTTDRVVRNNEEESVPDPVEINAKTLWKNFAKGYNVELLSPQQYNDNLWKLLSTLEFHFNSPVQASALLSPAGVEGNAVRFDNADCFILQLEGQSRWRLGRPTAPENELARTSGLAIRAESTTSAPNTDSISNRQMQCTDASVTSSCFNESSDVENDNAGCHYKWNNPLLDIVLDIGDTLYIPKGHVYQQHTLTKSHSLHLKISTNSSSCTVADLLELAIPRALNDSVESCLSLRRAIPPKYRKSLGVACSEIEEDCRRVELLKHLESLVENILVKKTLEVVDPAADQLAKQFIVDRLPVPLTIEEEAVSAAGAPNATIYPFTQLRMVRPGIAVAVVEDGMVVVYHCMENSREQHGVPVSPLEFELDDGPAIEALLQAYPKGVVVSDLDHSSEELEDKLELATALYKEGFLIIEDEASKPTSVRGATTTSSRIKGDVNNNSCIVRPNAPSITNNTGDESSVDNSSDCSDSDNNQSKDDTSESGSDINEPEQKNEVKLRNKFSKRAKNGRKNVFERVQRSDIDDDSPF